MESLNLDFPVHSVMGSVTNKKRIFQVCSVFDVNTIYHAAAYKHVPLVEENPFEGVFNNVFGSTYDFHDK